MPLTLALTENDGNNEIPRNSFPESEPSTSLILAIKQQNAEHRNAELITCAGWDAKERVSIRMSKKESA